MHGKKPLTKNEITVKEFELLAESIGDEFDLNIFTPRWKPISGTHDKKQIIENRFDLLKQIAS